MAWSLLIQNSYQPRYTQEESFPTSLSQAAPGRSKFAGFYVPQNFYPEVKVQWEQVVVSHGDSTKNSPPSIELSALFSLF